MIVPVGEAQEEHEARECKGMGEVPNSKEDDGDEQTSKDHSSSNRQLCRTDGATRDNSRDKIADGVDQYQENLVPVSQRRILQHFG